MNIYGFLLTMAIYSTACAEAARQVVAIYEKRRARRAYRSAIAAMERV